MKKAVLAAFLCIPLLSGCAFLDFFKKKDEPSVISVSQKINIDESLLRLCDPVTRIDPNSDMGIEYVMLLKKYGTCANRQKASADALRKIAE